MALAINECHGGLPDLTMLVSRIFHNPAQESNTLGCLKIQCARNMYLHLALPPILACTLVLAALELRFVIFYRYLFSDNFYQLPNQRDSTHNENPSLSAQDQQVSRLPRLRSLGCCFLSFLPCIHDLQSAYVHLG